jgi:hypothetical protein
MEVFLGFRIGPGNGIMEGWNDGPPEADQNDIDHFNFIVNPAGGGTINPTFHHPRTHYSIVPSCSASGG